MNIKNIIKRAGVIFIFGPIFATAIVINMLLILTIILWGPFYYIISGEDPFNALLNDWNSPFPIAFNIADWYLSKFGPKE